jgi:hypothetical protein
MRYLIVLAAMVLGTLSILFLAPHYLTPWDMNPGLTHCLGEKPGVCP